MESREAARLEGHQPTSWPFWEANRILEVRCGSRSHGLATPASDEDSRGVCVPPKEVLLGLDPFEQHQDERGDRVIFSLARFVRLALDANPNLLEALHVEEEDVLFADRWGRRLLEARSLFLSRKVADRFVGYALAQLERMKRHRRWLADPPAGPPDPADFGGADAGGRVVFAGAGHQKAWRAAAKRWEGYRRWQAERNPDRAALEERHGYDTKHAMHLCRLLVMGGEILAEGVVRVRRPDAPWLRSIRDGAMSYDDLLAWAHERVAAIGELAERSPLPEEPDRRAAGRLVVEIHEGYLFGAPR